MTRWTASLGVAFIVAGCATGKASAPQAPPSFGAVDNCPSGFDAAHESCGELLFASRSPATPRHARVSLTEKRIVLREKVHFAPGQATIEPASYPLLDEVAAELKRHPEVKKVAIDGHTDSTGDEAVNGALSRNRAQAVRNYLVAKAVDPARLDVNGFGPTRPVADNGTAKGREQNRRVDFVIQR